MKKIITFFLALSVVMTSFATETSSIAVPKKSSANANEILLPIGKNGEKISLMDLSYIKTRDFEKLTGNKMNFTKKIAFKLFQNKLKHSINAKGEVNTKAFEKMTVKVKKDTSKTRQYLRLWLILLAISVVFGILGWVSGFFWILSGLAGLGALIFFIVWLISMTGAV